MAKVPTDTQWQDLADRIKSKLDTSTWKTLPVYHTTKYSYPHEGNLNGTYTSAHDFFSASVTPVKSGLLDISFQIPAYTTSGTPFFDLAIDGTRIFAAAIPGGISSAFPVSVRLFYPTTVNVSHTITVKGRLSNATSYIVSGYSPCYFNIIEI